MRLTIPEEKHISIVPISLGKIPYVRKSKVESLQEATEIHKNITPSFIGSHLLGLEDGREVFTILVSFTNLLIVKLLLQAYIKRLD